MTRKSFDETLASGLLTISNVCKLVDVSRTIVQRWVDNNELKWFNIPGSRDVRISAQSLLDFLVANDYPVSEDIKKAAICYNERFNKKKVPFVQDIKQSTGYTPKDDK